MQTFIDEKIEFYKNEISSALDRNECMEALKSRAVLKELEEIKEYFTKNNININKTNHSCKDSLTAIEAAHKAGVSKSTISRNKVKFGGFPIGKNRWRFSIEKVLEAADEYLGKEKPGRKPKSN